MTQQSGWGRPVVDPMNLRSIMMLDVAREMMLDEGWPHKAITVSMTDPEHPDTPAVSFLGVNDPRGLARVNSGRVDVGTLNPVAMLNMARLGLNRACSKGATSVGESGSVTSTSRGIPAGTRRQLPQARQP